MGHNKAVAATFIVALLWSLAGFLIKSIHMTPFALTSGKCLLTAVFLIPVVHSIHGFKIDRYVILGSFFYAAFTYCFNISTKLTVSAIAIVMQYTAPIYVALLSNIFLKEKITRADIYELIFVCLGMVLFFLDKITGGSFLGNVISIFNGVTFAGLAICFRLQKNQSPIASVFLGNLLGAIIGFPALVSNGMPDYSSLIYLTLFAGQAAFTFTLYSEASKYLSGLETVLLPIFDPILNPVWVYLFLGEKIGFMSICGMIIVLLSISLRVVYGLKCVK